MTNVVLITIDCLRFDAISPNYTPYLWGLQHKGLFFIRAHSLSSWTTPSLLGLLTSTYPLMNNGELTLKYPRISISEILKRKGYSTIGITYHPYLGRYYGFYRGFDVYLDDYKKKNKDFYNYRYRDHASKMFRENIKNILKSKYVPKFLQNYVWYKLLYKRISSGNLPYLRGYEINSQVKEYIDGTSEPFFLWIHYLDTHFPYVPRKSEFDINKIARLNVEREKWFKSNKKVNNEKLEEIRKLYFLTAKDVDEYVKEIVQYFERKGIYKNTIFIITADHGEEFYEHGGFHHEIKLYEEHIHVPLLIFGWKIKTKIISRPVSHIDVFPTILDFIEMEHPQEWFGKNMLLKKSNIVISEEGQTHHGSAFKGSQLSLDFSATKIAILQNKWKYIWDKQHEELYDLQKDPSETQNLAKIKKYKDKMNVFKNILEDHLQMIHKFTYEKFIIRKVIRRKQYERK